MDAAPRVFISAGMISVWGEMGNISFVLNTIGSLAVPVGCGEDRQNALVWNDCRSSSMHRGGWAVMRASTTFYDAANDDVKNRNEEQVQGGGGNHASENGSADGDSSGAARTGGEHEWHDAQNKGERRHQDGTQANSGGLDGGLDG